MGLLPTVGVTATPNERVIKCTRDISFAPFDNNLPSPIVNSFSSFLSCYHSHRIGPGIIESFLVYRFPPSRHELPIFLRRPSVPQCNNSNAIGQ